MTDDSGQVFREAHMIQAPRTVGHTGTTAHVPGQHMKACAQQEPGQTQNILAPAVAFQAMGKYGYPPLLHARPWAIAVHIQKVSVLRIQPHLSARKGFFGRNVHAPEQYRPYGIDVGITQPERRLITAGQYRHDDRPQNSLKRRMSLIEKKAAH